MKCPLCGYNTAIGHGLDCPVALQERQNAAQKEHHGRMEREAAAQTALLEQSLEEQREREEARAEREEEREERELAREAREEARERRKAARRRQEASEKQLRAEAADRIAALHDDLRGAKRTDGAPRLIALLWLQARADVFKPADFEAGQRRELADLRDSVDNAIATAETELGADDAKPLTSWFALERERAGMLALAFERGSMGGGTLAVKDADEAALAAYRHEVEALTTKLSREFDELRAAPVPATPADVRRSLLEDHPVERERLGLGADRLTENATRGEIPNYAELQERGEKGLEAIGSAERDQPPTEAPDAGFLSGVLGVLVRLSAVGMVGAIGLASWEYVLAAATAPHASAPLPYDKLFYVCVLLSATVALLVGRAVLRQRVKLATARWEARVRAHRGRMAEAIVDGVLYHAAWSLKIAMFEDRIRRAKSAIDALNDVAQFERASGDRLRALRATQANLAPAMFRAAMDSAVGKLAWNARREDVELQGEEE